MSRDIAQEFHFDCEQATVPRFFYLAASAHDIWDKRAKAMADNKVYFGG